jgi:type VI secretion system secreted protein Hcp
MATDIHLKIDGIKGEATADKHADEIEILSWNWRIEQPISFSGTGMSGGKANVRNLMVRKFVDKSSPNLLKYCLNGKHLPEMVLTQQRSGEGAIQYIKITLKDAMIAEVTDTGANGNEVPQEDVGIAFGAVEYEYTPQKKDGKTDGAVTLKWDVKANKEA